MPSRRNSIARKTDATPLNIHGAPLFVLRRAFPAGYRLPQDEFHLRIDAAQIVRGPFFDFLQKIRRNPQKKRFALLR
jgi:hypothetical protein